MKLFTSKLISYEEALRQTSNPDDFALKVSGISSTSDASWDNFEHKDEKVDEVLKEEKINIDRF
jgi:twitching motility protein PilT